MPALFADQAALYLIYQIEALFCLIVTAVLWYQNRRHYPATFLWFVNNLLQFSGFLLLASGSRIPQIFSVVTANIMMTGGTILLLAGLEQFAGKKGHHLQNIAVLAMLIPVQLYFTYLVPDLNARLLSFSFALAFIFTQTVWLIFFRIKQRRSAFVPCGVVLSAFLLINLANIAMNLLSFGPEGAPHFAHSGIATMLANMTLSTLFTFALVLLVNKRLQSDLEGELATHRRVERELRASEERFSKAFLTSPYAILVTRIESGSFIEVNEAFLEISAYSRGEIEGQSTASLGIWKNPADRELVINELLSGKSVRGRVMQFRRKDGNEITGLFSSQRINIAGEDCILSSIADISDTLQTEEDLRRHRQFLYDIIERSGTLICVKDREGRYDLVNSAWEKVTGISRGEALGRTDAELFGIEESAHFQQNDLRVINHGESVEIEEFLKIKGSDHYFISVKFPLRDKSGSVSGLCAMITDITERKQAEEKISYLASHDALTDLPGLRLAKERLGLALSLAQRQGGVIAIMFVDLDDFKGVNDQLGHDAGDFVLTQVAKRFLDCVRESDTVARIGGDEFLVILTGLASLDDAARIAQKLIDTIQKPYDYHGHEARIGLSIGIAEIRNGDEDLNDILIKADNAMYRIKKQGKNGYCFAPDLSTP